MNKFLWGDGTEVVKPISLQNFL